MAYLSVKSMKPRSYEADGRSTVSNEEDATSTSGTSPQLILHLQKQFLRPYRNQLQLLLQLWNQVLQLKRSWILFKPRLTAEVDTSALTAEEISNVTEAIKGSNWTAVSFVVSNDGFCSCYICRWLKRNIVSFSNS